MTSMIDEILAQIPAEDLAARLDTDPDTAMDAARKALPVLLGGLSSNVAAGGGDALGTAVLRDHADGLLDAPDFLKSVDADDGQKILGHIFGDRQDQVVETLGARSSAGSSIFSKLLPLMAPLVMSWLAKKVGGMFSGGGAQASGALTESQSSGGLGGLLGGLFGGGDQSAPGQSQPTQESGSGGGLGGLLGGLFGGGGGDSAVNQSQPTQESGSGGGLGGLLGGLFGGGDQSAPSQSQPTQASTGMGGLGGLGGLLGDLLGGEVQQAKSSMPDIADLFDILGDTSGSDAGADSK